MSHLFMSEDYVARVCVSFVLKAQLDKPQNSFNPFTARNKEDFQTA